MQDTSFWLTMEVVQFIIIYDRHVEVVQVKVFPTGGITYSLHTQVMLILILIDAHYLQNVVFSFEKGSGGQNHF